METKRAYRRAESYIGETFNRLTILRICGANRKNRPIVECKCSCGKLHQVALEHVRNGDSKSCGCLLREQLSLPTELRVPSRPSKKFSGQTKEAKRASQAKWRKANASKVAATAKRFRERHEEEVAKSKAVYFQTIKKVRLEKVKARFAADPIFRLEHIIRSRITKNIKHVKDSKSRSTMAMLGCSVVECRKHIENLFSEGMSWDKFMKGEIHLDHTKPIRAFDLSTTEGRAAAFNFKNLQPLWKKDNLRKSDKLPNGRRARELTFKEVA